ncbi:arrestin domain-containing protein 3-like [Calliphora vicina]|uniref:arrestin domain-containing protein 3-like n=1 Tax=Calliphora vicina TaxID=7373 RepID=UPI00325B5115
MPSTCEFQLNNSNAVYYSGEVVSGAIVLKTLFAKDVRDIRLIFRGEGKVSWTETESRKHSDGTRTNESVNFIANEVYMDNTTTVHDEGILRPGTYTYRFEIPLPEETPTACEGRYGHIRYILALMLRRPSCFDNTFSKPLTVIKSQDLNLNPDFRIPIVTENIVNSCCWSCLSGNINTILKVPFGGYAIGQRVKFSVIIQNHSMTDIHSYTIEFIRRMTFTARSPHQRRRHDLTILHTKIYDNRCKPWTMSNFDGDFPIVSTPPSTEGDSILRVGYSLKVTFHMGGFSANNNNNSLSLPIFIGDVPLRESFVTSEDMESDRFIDAAPTAPELFSDDPDLPPSYQELCPPSFEEAIRSGSPFIDIDKDEHNRHIGFRPLYPMYSQSDD